MKQAPLAFFLHLSAGLEKLGFKPGVNEPGIFYGHGMAIVVWVDNCLFFGPDEDKINEIILELKKDFILKEEDTQGDVFTFLGVQINNLYVNYVMSQHNLIKKVFVELAL